VQSKPHSKVCGKKSPKEKESANKLRKLLFSFLFCDAVKNIDLTTSAQNVAQQNLVSKATHQHLSEMDSSGWRHDVSYTCCIRIIIENVFNGVSH
jgi:hypothetical protein